MGYDENSQRDRSAGRGQPSSAYVSGTSGLDDLAERLGELARGLHAEPGVEGTLQAIVQSTVDTVPGAEQASISAVSQRRDVLTLASTGELALQVDQAQYDTGEGPCLSALYEQQTFRLCDLDSDSPWPKFTARVKDSGLGSLLAIQLYVTGEDLGALNIHSTRPDAFDDQSEDVALLFAAHAAVALAASQEKENLNTAVGARDLIGQAKGILMERYKIDDQQAFRLLVTASQSTNIKLRDIAQHLARTGELPTRRS